MDFHMLFCTIRCLKPDTIEGSFTGKEPAYEDDFVAIYSLERLFLILLVTIIQTSLHGVGC